MGKDTVVGLFVSSAEKNRDRNAFNYYDGSWNAVTYRDLLRYTRAIASYLIGLGIKPGDRMAIISENRYEWCATYLAILMAGGTAVPLDAQLGEGEIRTLVSDSGAVLLFHSNRTGQNVKVSVKSVNFDSHEFLKVCTTRETASCPETSGDDLASLVYTSGTTGIPKGVMLTHRNLCSDAKAIEEARIMTSEDSMLSILPLHHTYACMCTFLVPLFLGITITYPPGMKGPELMSTTKEKDISILLAVPLLLELIRNGILRKMEGMNPAVSSIIFLLLRTCGVVRKRTGINMGKPLFKSLHRGFGSRFRFFASGGARLDPKVMEDLEALGFTVIEGYGLTETSPVVTFNPIKKRKAGSAGKPLPTVEIKIINPSETGEGEIAIRGPMVMKGYYRNAEATAKVIQDGWFLSGDLGCLDHEGYLFITGRVKEVIVLSSGKNIYPEDVEREYLKIPLVKEICVTALEERGMVESLKGVIVPDLDLAKRERIGNLQESLKWEINKVSSTLPSYMRLKGFTLRTDPLPRTPLGKLKRYMISETLRREAGTPKDRGEDKGLVEDETGRTVIACIGPLLKEPVSIHSSDNLELDLGLDSLQRIELVSALEKALLISLPETFASEVQTVGELVTKLKEIRESGGVQVAGIPLTAEVSGEEPTEKEKEIVGLRQGMIESTCSLFLLKVTRGILKTFFRLEVRGIEQVPEPPFIIAPNHSSNMDGFVISAALPSKVFKILYFLGFQAYFSGSWPAVLFGRVAHIIPIDPETFLGKALKLSSYVLRKRKSLCIFPEGGRTFDGNVMEFKKGIGILAFRHNVPVVPAYIDGTFRALPRGTRWPRLTRISLTFGKPLPLSELDLSKKPEGVDEYQFFADELRKRVKELRTI